MGQRLKLPCGVLLTASLLGCGPAASPGSTTPALLVEAPGEGRDSYETRPTDEPVSGDGAGAVEAGILSAAGSRGVTMTGDGRLSRLAQWTAAHLGDGGAPPPHEVVEFFAQHLGLVEPVPHLLVLGQPDPAALQGSIEDSVGQFLDREAYNYYGGAIVERSGLTIAVVCLSRRWLELDPVPRHVPAGRAIPVRGRLTGRFRAPVVAVASPSGDVRRIEAGEGPAFELSIPTEGPGRYGVELLAQGPRGDTVLANFPVFVGITTPQSVALQAEEGPGEASDPRAVAASLLSAMNRSRSEQGLPPLTLHPGLAEVARQHSRDMIDNRFVGHTSPTTGGAADRVERAGYRSGLVLENIGRGYGAAEIHRGLVGSPGHRANLLNADVTHVGVGVVSEQEGGRTAFVVTQIFVLMPRSIDVASAPAALVEMINRGRAARGAEPLEIDPNLAEAAAEGARRYFAEPALGQQDVVDEASGSLRRFSIAFRRVGGLMVVVSHIEDASRLDPTFDPEVRYVGIGVAQGNRPDAPANSIAVVILLAWPR